jgi:hypothetical protein
MGLLPIQQTLIAGQISPDRGQSSHPNCGYMRHRHGACIAEERMGPTTSVGLQVNEEVQ